MPNELFGFVPCPQPWPDKHHTWWKITHRSQPHSPHTGNGASSSKLPRKRDVFPIQPLSAFWSIALRFFVMIPWDISERTGNAQELTFPVWVKPKHDKGKLMPPMLNVIVNAECKITKISIVQPCKVWDQTDTKHLFVKRDWCLSIGWAPLSTLPLLKAGLPSKRLGCSRRNSAPGRRHPSTFHGWVRSEQNQNAKRHMSQQNTLHFDAVGFTMIFYTRLIIWAVFFLPCFQPSETSLLNHTSHFHRKYSKITIHLQGFQLDLPSDSVVTKQLEWFALAWPVQAAMRAREIFLPLRKVLLVALSW